MALVARVVATVNEPTTELFSLRRTVTLYRLHVRQFSDSQRSWCVLRRYSEFVQLRDGLASSVGELPTLPPKLVMNTTEDLASRYAELDAFLRSLLSLPLAAAHASLRSFLGADAAAVSSAVASRLIEDAWDHEPEVETGGAASAVDLDPPAGADDVQHPWLLTGRWVADEARCRDRLDPLLKAMGTPWAIRSTLRGLTIVSTLMHTPGEALVEVTSSRFGEGKPTRFELDGETRVLWMGRREGAVR